MTLTHDEQSLAAPYALGALDASERRAFEAHMATCAACQQELRDLQPIVDALAYAVPRRTPRPELRERVLRPITGTTAGAPAPVRAPRSWLPLAAAILLAVALGSAAWWSYARVSMLDARLQDSERRAADAERQVTEARQAAQDAQTALAILTAPDLVRIDLAGQTPAPRASARALWSRSNGMVFTATDSASAPARPRVPGLGRHGRGARECGTARARTRGPGNGCLPHTLRHRYTGRGSGDPRARGRGACPDRRQVPSSARRARRCDPGRDGWAVPPKHPGTNATRKSG